MVATDPSELAGSRVGDGWVLSPAALDACFFACGSFVWFRYGVVAIPKQIDRILLGRQPIAEETCLVHLKLRSRSETGAIFDFTLFGQDDEVLLQLEGYHNTIVAEVPAEAK